MPLPYPRPSVTNLGAIVEAVVAGYRTVEVEFIDPLAGTVAAPYDPTTGLGGEKTYPILWEATARIVALGTSDSSTPEEWGTKRGFQIDIPLAPTLPHLRKGIIMRPKGGGDDPRLWSFAYTVQSAVDSSIANQRTIMAISDLAEISD